MLPYRTNKLTFILFGVFFVAILGYALFEARTVIEGPTIDMSGGAEAVVVHEPLVVIKGAARNITEVRMNGRIIPTTEAGAFEEAHLLAEGYNAIVLTARDKIGRTTMKKLEIVYEPQPGATTTEQHLQTAQ